MLRRTVNSHTVSANTEHINIKQLLCYAEQSTLTQWVQTQNISLILCRSYITQIFMWQTWLVFLLNKFIIIASIFWTYKLVWHILLDTWTICNSFEWNKFAAKWYSWTTQILHSGAVTNWRKMYNRQANDKIKPNYCTNPSKLVASSSETTEGAGCSQWITSSSPGSWLSPVKHTQH